MADGKILENWISTADVARFFDASERAVYTWINNGTLRPVGQIGRQYYFTIEEVREACKENKLR